jgi:hypothetical protein
MDENTTLTYSAFTQAREITSHEHTELRDFLRAKVVKTEVRPKGTKPAYSGKESHSKKQG